MEELNEALYEKLLDFDSARRAEWIRDRKPYAVLFELTPRCNFNCVHCYLHDSHRMDALSAGQVKQIMDILCEKGILFLTLTGGEILTRPDFAELYLYAKKKGFLVELFTNGYLFNDELIGILREYPPLLVSVSFYGANDDTCRRVTGVRDSFSRVYENCRKLKEAGIRLSVKSPIMSLTEAEMPRMKKLAEDIGLEMIFSFEIHSAADGSSGPLKYRTKLSSALSYEFQDYLGRKNGPDTERIAKNTLALKNDPHIFTCNVASNSFVVDYKGNMLPCMKLRHRGISLLEHDFDEIWEKFKIYKEYKASPGYICKKCDAVYFCDVCPAEMDLLCGNMEHRDCENCRPAKIRRAFYLGEISYDEAMKMADL